MTWNSWIVFELPQVSSARVGYKAALDMARRAFRREAWSEAESLLMQAGVIAGNDPAFFNLVGILREVEGNKEAAGSFYGKAIRADSNYAPAQQNMRRLYELRTFGHTSQMVCLGDEPQLLEID
ncbi:MAG TPA: hypothetical protein VGQ99_11255 [Tepidisphaeraceae bacterium]|jgi:tetratricopeptide (TPR) repeat protein|nr:hypothetical protein [Tepidisphaeraceae bacterium]